MANTTTADITASFTLGEIRLIRQLYHELSIDELAIFFGKSSQEIRELVQELDLKKGEVCCG